ncbi:MAG: sulfotransferase [Aquisalimonadaceae bacterium]
MNSLVNSRSNFFIIGAPKCGTTALASWLSEHPQVFMSPVKEPHYFSTDLKNRSSRSEGEYRRLFSKVNEKHRAVGEASVWYLYSQEAVANILATYRDARIIVCLRNPVDMAYSLHGQHLMSANEHIQDFKEAWEAQDERARGRKVPRLCEDERLLLYGPACSLGAQMNRLFGCARKDQVLTLLLEDIKKDPKGIYRQVLAFLAVFDLGRDDFPVINAASQRRVPALHRAAKSINNLRRKLGVPRLGTGVMPLLDKINRKPSARGGLDESMRKMLVDYFASDIEKLEGLVDRDLSHWKT